MIFIAVSPQKSLSSVDLPRALSLFFNLVDRIIVDFQGFIDYLIIMGIAHEPRLLLADEPTAALDPLQARKLFDLIVEISRNFNITALIVSHDWDLVRDCGIRNIRGHPLTSSKRGTEFRDNP